MGIPNINKSMIKSVKEDSVCFLRSEDETNLTKDFLLIHSALQVIHQKSWLSPLLYWKDKTVERKIAHMLQKWRRLSRISNKNVDGWRNVHRKTIFWGGANFSSWTNQT